MTREEKINRLSEALAEEMIDTWDDEELKERLGLLPGWGIKTDEEVAREYYRERLEKHTDDELDNTWWWMSDYKGNV
jgi:hypothetical protein